MVLACNARTVMIRPLASVRLGCRVASKVHRSLAALSSASASLPFRNNQVVQAEKAGPASSSKRGNGANARAVITSTLPSLD